MTGGQAYEAESAQLRRLARDPGTTWVFRDHCLDEMVNDGIELPDPYHVIRSGRIAEVRLENGEWRYRIEGRNKDGIAMAFPVIFSEEDRRIEVVTAWIVKRKE